MQGLKEYLKPYVQNQRENLAVTVPDHFTIDTVRVGNLPNRDRWPSTEQSKEE